jgi:hypothetical protein
MASAMGMPTPTPTFRPRFELEWLPPLDRIVEEPAGVVSLITKRGIRGEGITLSADCHSYLTLASPCPDSPVRGGTDKTGYCDSGFCRGNYCCDNFCLEDNDICSRCWKYCNCTSSRIDN